jgi:hypothetical protein
MQSETIRIRRNAARVIQRAWDNHAYNIEKYEFACARHWHFGPDEIDGMRAFLRVESALDKLESIGLTAYRDPDGTVKIVRR